MGSATVIIPTTGAASLERCVASVLAQTAEHVIAFLVVDGPNFQPAVVSSLGGRKSERIRLLVLPENIGGNGFYGHRVFAGCSHFVNTDFVLFLDQDNWLEPEHVASLTDTIRNSKLDWAHCMRRIHTAEGQFVTNDDCESLGRWPGWQNYKLVDTSSYCLKREVAAAVASAWHGGWGQDRFYFAALDRHFPRYATTGQYTLNYRLGGNPNSVKAGFFLSGNAAMRLRYPGGFPWQVRTSLVEGELR
jgi:glycosyltransferase involved in cell wall biosynthesis